MVKNENLHAVNFPGNDMVTLRLTSDRVTQTIKLETYGYDVVHNLQSVAVELPLYVAISLASTILLDVRSLLEWNLARCKGEPTGPGPVREIPEHSEYVAAKRRREKREKRERELQKVAFRLQEMSRKEPIFEKVIDDAHAESLAETLLDDLFLGEP